MKKNNLSKFTLVFIAIITICFNFIYSPKNILSWDIFGYYLYLPTFFIYNDLGMENFDVIHEIIEKYHNTATFYQAMQLPMGNWVMKYSMGLAILFLPFFLIGHAIALFLGYPADGFSLPYQYSIFIGGIIFTIIGIYFLRKILLKYFSDKVTSLVLIAIVFSTNYFFHTSFHGQNAMSHNYIFTLYVFILFLTIKWYNSYKLKNIVFLGLVCGITILSRPSEIVCLLIPLLWGVTGKSSFLDKLNLLFKYKYHIAIFTLILILIGFFQFIYWKVYTGEFVYYSYGGNAGEGFEFFHPYIVEVLFSFRKGWLIYTPIMFFSIVGLIIIYQKNRFIFYSVFLYFILNLYIVSSWSCWWYAESYSQRSLIQSYVVMALPLGYFIQYIMTSRKVIVQSLLCILFIFLTGLNLFQTWQIEKGIIHGSRMTKDYYLSIFGKTTVNEGKKKLLLINRSFDAKEQFTDIDEYKKKILEIKDFDSLQYDKIITQYSFSGKVSYQLNEKRIYSPAIEATYSEITDHDHAWIRGSVMVYPLTEIKSNPSSLVICFEHNGHAYKYKSLDFEQLQLKLNNWNKVSFDYLTPEVRNKKDKLKVYVWHRGKEKIFIDDLKVEVFELK